MSWRRRERGPEPPPLPRREYLAFQTAFTALCETHSLTRGYLAVDLDGSVDAAMVVCEVDSLVTDALLDLYSLSGLGP